MSVRESRRWPRRLATGGAIVVGAGALVVGATVAAYVAACVGIGRAKFGMLTDNVAKG